MANQTRTRALGGDLTSTDTTVGDSSAVLVAADGGRRALVIQNRDDTDAVYLSCGSAATTSDLKLAAGQTLNFAAIGLVPINAVHAIADSAATPVAIITG